MPPALYPYFPPNLQRPQRHEFADIGRTIPLRSVMSNPSPPLSTSPSSSSSSSSSSYTSILAPNSSQDSYPKSITLHSMNGHPFRFEVGSKTMEEEIKTSVVSSRIVLYENGKSLNYSQLRDKYLSLKQSVADHENSRLSASPSSCSSSSPPSPPPPVPSLNSNKILEELVLLRRYVEKFKHIQMELQYDIFHNVKTIRTNQEEKKRKEQDNKRKRQEHEEEEEDEDEEEAQEEEQEEVNRELQLKNSKKRAKKEEDNERKEKKIERKQASHEQQKKISRRNRLQKMRRERIREAEIQAEITKAKPKVTTSEVKVSCVRCGRTNPPGGLHVLGNTTTWICCVKKNCPKLLPSRKELRRAFIRSRKSTENTMNEDQ